jgi:HK97 family phage major capsid protein
MPEVEEKKVEVSLPADLARRFAEAQNPQERNAVLAEFAGTRGAEKPTAEKAAAVMSDEQFRSLMDTIGTVSADQAKAAIKSVAAEAEKRYNLNPDQAEEVAEKSFLRAEDRHINERADWEVIARVFKGIYLARTGKPDLYRQSLEEENAHYQKRFGRQTRAMSNTTDSSGGYLSPQLFSDYLYENIQRTSLVRKYATMLPMNGYEVINIPTVSSGISAAQVSEATGSTGVQPTFSQKQLTTKKIMSKTKPISLELVEKANPAIVPLLLRWATVEIMKAEDSLVFGTTGNGIRAAAANLTSGSAAAGYDSYDFDDLIDMESQLNPEFLAGDDIQGSGLIGGAPQYWIAHAFMQAMKKKKETGTGAYMDEAKELRSLKQIFGYHAQRVLSLPTTAALASGGSGTKVAVFGNLGYVWCGYEPGLRVDLMTEGSIDDGGSLVSLADTGQVGVRVIEFFDNVVVDGNAFSIMAAAA